MLYVNVFAVPLCARAILSVACVGASLVCNHLGSSESRFRLAVMIFRFLALGAVLLAPLLVVEKGPHSLRGAPVPLSFSSADSSREPHHGPVAESTEESFVGDKADPVVFGWAPSASSQASSAAGGTPCRPCEAASPPTHLGVVGRFIHEALVSESVQFDRAFWIFVSAYAGSSAWRWSSSAAPDQYRRGSRTVASEGVRPRGAGDRAGLAAPRGV